MLRVQLCWCLLPHVRQALRHDRQRLLLRVGYCVRLRNGNGYDFQGVRFYCQGTRLSHVPPCLLLGSHTCVHRSRQGQDRLRRGHLRSRPWMRHPGLHSDRDGARQDEHTNVLH